MTYTLTDKQLRELTAGIAREAVRATLDELNIKSSTDPTWITQSHAYRLLSRRKIDKAMREGKLRFEKDDMDKKQGRVKVLYADIIKLKKQIA